MSNQHDNTYGGERDGTDPEALFDDIDDIEADEEAEDREAAESGEDASGQTRRHPAEIIAALNVENNELKDRALRVTADMENLRRRTEREIGDAKRYAVSKFARDILAVSDNLARALEAVPAEAREAADATLKSLLEGVEMTERELQNALSKNGVVKLEPHGEKFDPNLHQAMFEIPNPEMPDGAVAQVMQSGYKIGDRVLRPAMVGVARGGPKGFPAPAENSGPDDGAAEPGSEVDKSV